MLAVLTGACVAVLSFGIVPVMLDLMSTPGDVIVPASQYLRIFLWGCRRCFCII